MTHPLKGLQFRLLKEGLPSWKTEDNYAEWQNVEDNTSVVFPTGTQFRTPPIIRYVTSSGPTAETFNTKDAAMSKASFHVEADEVATIRKIEEPGKDVAAFLAGNKVQYMNGSTWRDVTYLNVNTLPNRTHFRIRPDQHYKVSYSLPMAGEVTFDDIEKLAEYVNNKIRTNMLNFTVKAVPYDV